MAAYVAAIIACVAAPVAGLCANATEKSSLPGLGLHARRLAMVGIMIPAPY